MAEEAPAVEPAWLAARLEPIARQLGLAPGAVSAPALARYATRLLAWGRRINLTGARTPERLADEHLADALALVPHLPEGPRRLVDVGSGAGLPGLVLALLRPELSVLLLEPNAKKLAFLRGVRRELGLTGLEIRSERLEAFLDSHPEPGFDVALSRATWPLTDWLERGRPLVRPGGLVLGLEGRERQALPRGVSRHPYRLPVGERAVVRLRV